jgi:hypothetical protein
MPKEVQNSFSTKREAAESRNELVEKNFLTLKTPVISLSLIFVSGISLRFRPSGLFDKHRELIKIALCQERRAANI